MIRLLIAEDEPHSRLRLKEVLATRPSEAEMQVDVRLSDSGLARFLKRDR